MSDRVAEVEAQIDGLPFFRQPDWSSRYPGLIQGVSRRERELGFKAPPGVDEGAAPAAPAAPGAQPAWERLRRATGFRRLVRCRQVHGSKVIGCSDEAEPGVDFLGEADALVTDRPDTLLTVTVADCVPVFLLDPDTRVLGLAHAGWRGIAAGVIGTAIGRMESLGAKAARLVVHLGPAVCGDCYEVGPEVPAALGIEGDPRFVDLRHSAAERLLEAGVDADALTISENCTLCDTTSFFSHRGGDRTERMCAFLGGACG